MDDEGSNPLYEDTECELDDSAGLPVGSRYFGKCNVSITIMVDGLEDTEDDGL